MRLNCPRFETDSTRLQFYSYDFTSNAWIKTMLLFNYSILLYFHKPTAYTVRTETSKTMTVLLANISVHIAKVIFQLQSPFSYFSFIKARFEISYHKIFSSYERISNGEVFQFNPFFFPLTDQIGLYLLQVSQYIVPNECVSTENENLRDCDSMFVSYFSLQKKKLPTF